MRRIPLALAFCSVFTLVCTHATGQETTPHDPALPSERRDAPSMIVDRPLHDFGSILDDRPVTTRFTFVNDGSATLRITGIAPSCKCTSGVIETAECDPGESGAISVSFDPSGRDGAQAQFVTLSTNDPERPTVRLDIRANVRPLVFASPRAAGFGSVEKDHIAETTLLIAGRTDDFRVLEALADNPDLIRVEIGDTELREFEGEPEPLPSTALKVRLLKGTPVGLLRQFITIRTNDPRRETLRVDAVASVVGDIEVTPERIQLGAIVIGESVEREIVIRSRSGRPFTIRDVKNTTADPDACRVTLTPIAGPDGTPPSAYTLTLKITMPEHGRAVRGHLTIQTDVDREWTKSVIYGASPRRRHAPTATPPAAPPR
ncbi:MAG: DUF1573 domain-containing protein [Leptolyngbya sp. PLA2]|nr:DUF1573 domain-containing protein [Leptolyngbya sp.]MCE7970925.1 DUF1573 domain-containing protein [Leptolyngbya sp. PL-A2]MCQ3940260.1 hypothetical protein [cyanobacterium CYA1]MDL1904670.1 DUF1573 domain-containing protein [Synechococcales cyanobacterium CNB]GIK20422.1 MAG: hypothetical protein BroJett004_25860 [Planctomycetota bacterium]